MAAVALGLASSLTWGFADFFGGLQSRRRAVLAVIVVGQLAGLVFLFAIDAVRGVGPPPAGSWIVWAVAGGLSGVIGLGAFYRGFQVGNMGVVAPISSASAILPLVVGLATGERPRALQAVGVVLAVTGVVLASREESEPGGPRQAAAGAWLAVGAALGFGGFFVFMDRASEADATWAITVARCASLTALLAAAAVTRTRLPRSPRDLAALLPIGILDTGANLLFALATTFGLLSLVGVLGSVYPIVTVVLARLFLHERMHVLQRAGAVGALAGAALISAG